MFVGISMSLSELIYHCWSSSFVVVLVSMYRITFLFCMLRCGTSLSRRALLPSKRFVVCIRHISKVNQPQYPSPRDQELVNKYFYDVTVEGAKSELEDAMKVNSPLPHLLCNLLVVQIYSDELASKSNKKEPRDCRSTPRLLCIDLSVVLLVETMCEESSPYNTYGICWLL